MHRYFSSCAVDGQVLKEELFEFMDNPIEYFVNRPDDVKGACVFISTIQLISLLLGNSYFGSFLVILIAATSFISSAVTGLVSKSIKDEIIKLSIIQLISNGEARWAYVQYTLSVGLASSNFISLILQVALATKFTIYLFTSIMSIVLFAAYTIECLASIRIDDGNKDERVQIHPAEEAV